MSLPGLLVFAVALAGSALAVFGEEREEPAKPEAVTDQSAPEPAGPVVVLVFDAGPPLRLEDVEQVASLDQEVRETARHAWVWSSEEPPRRLGLDEIPGALREPAEPRALEVRVRSAQDLAKARVRLIAAPLAAWADLPEPTLPAWPVPASGKVRIPVDTGSAWGVRAVGESLGTWWHFLDRGAGSLTVDLGAAETRTLRVADREGVALEHARLRLNRPSERLNPRGPPLLAQYFADDAGEITIPSVPDRELMLIAAARGHVPKSHVGTWTGLPAEIRLEPGRRLIGRWLDENDAPLAGVGVRARYWVSGDAAQPVRNATESSADGRWALEGLPAGKIALTAGRAGLATFHRVLELDAEADEHDLGEIRLAKALQLEIEVVDDLRQPVAGARVAVPPRDPVWTGHDGRALIDGIDPGKAVDVHAVADGHLPGEQHAGPPFGDSVRVILPRAFRVRGRFVDHRGRPVADGTVEILRGNTSDSEPISPDGVLEVDLPPAAAIDLVLVSSSTRELRIAVAPGEAGEERDLGDLVAPPGYRVVGRLVDDLGEPVPNGQLWTPRVGRQAPILAWMHRDLLAAWSDSAGRFELAGLGSGPVVLYVEAAGFARRRLPAQIEPEQPAEDLGDVVLRRGATLRVAAEGYGARDVYARVDFDEERLEMDMLQAPVVEGGAEIANVPAGDVIVSVREGRSILCETRIDVPADSSEVEADCSRSPILVEGSVLIGEHEAGSGTLRWEVPRQGRTGAIIERRTVDGLVIQAAFGGGSDPVFVDVDDSGSFATTDLRPGTWEVTWQGGSGNSRTLEVVLDRRTPQRVTLRLPGFSVAGRVVDADGQPVTGADVVIVDSRARTRSGTDGSFQLVGLEAGVRTVRAFLKTRSSTPLEVTVGSPGEPVDSLLLVVGNESEETLEVRVRRPAGTPAAGTLVFVELEGEPLLRFVSADVRGTVSFKVQTPHAERVRIAIFDEGRWSFGTWLPWPDEPLDVVLEDGAPGSLSVAAAGDVHGTPSIVTSTGWDLTRLLMTVVMPPRVGPGLPAIVAGLPEGRYRVSLGDWQTVATVEAWRRTEVEIR